MKLQWSKLYKKLNGRIYDKWLKVKMRQDKPDAKQIIKDYQEHMKPVAFKLNFKTDTRPFY